ncbi:hypothetical protein [Marinicauda sp. Alg238-R41]|uniref:hypothetical protein n=1 Tax=Marinicauda sp. Alg238-R41 TaxID=2993447 RepID=UPI0022E46DF5|nr:hypothetical protein [Marinicauda sp. Alg238-R41]
MLLALDQSSSRTGVCKGRPEGPVASYSFGLPKCGDDFGLALTLYDAWLERQLEDVDLIAFERPVNPSCLHLRTARLLYGIAGVIEMVAHRRRIAAVEADTNKLKKLIYGRGGKKPKPDEACMHARRWGFDPANGDEADACGVWLITVQYQFPDAFNRVWLPKRSAAA